MSECGRTYGSNGISAVEVYIILNLSRQQVNMEEVICVQSVGADHIEMTYLYKHVRYFFVVLKSGSQKRD